MSFLSIKSKMLNKFTNNEVEDKQSDTKKNEYFLTFTQTQINSLNKEFLDQSYKGKLSIIFRKYAKPKIQKNNLRLRPCFYFKLFMYINYENCY